VLDVDGKVLRISARSNLRNFGKENLATDETRIEHRFISAKSATVIFIRVLICVQSVAKEIE